MQRPFVTWAMTLFVCATACRQDAANPAAPGAPNFAKTTISDPTSTFEFPLDDALVSVRGDHLFPDATGTYTTYANGVCGVGTRIFATTAGSNSGDATLQTAGTPDRKCPAYPRKLTLIYGPGDSETVSILANLHELQSSSRFIPIGTTAKRFFGIGGTRCDRVQWGSSSGGDSVLVSRLDASTWLVQTQASPNDQAYCVTTGVLYHMPLRFVVLSSRPLDG